MRIHLVLRESLANIVYAMYALIVFSVCIIHSFCNLLVIDCKMLSKLVHKVICNDMATLITVLQVLLFNSF